MDDTDRRGTGDREGGASGAVGDAGDRIDGDRESGGGGGSRESDDGREDADPVGGATTDGAGDERRSTVGALRERLGRIADVLRGSTIEARPLRPAEDGPLATFDAPAGHEEVARYWVDAPFAYVVVTYDDRRSEHRYHAVEPDLDPFERDLLERVRVDVRDPLLFRESLGGERGSGGGESNGGGIGNRSGDGSGSGGADADVAAALRAEIRGVVEGYGVEVDAGTFHSIAYYLDRDFRGFGKAGPLFDDPRIEDISCDGYGRPLFVYHDEYDDVETNVVFGREELDGYVVRLAQQSGQHVSVGDPVVGATLPDGSRAELALGEEVTPHGSAFTVRQYAEEPFTPIDLIDYGTFSVEMMAYLWLCIEHNKSLIFAGGTASGKTTSMNAVSMFIPPRAKVLTIEDTRELALHHDNWLSSVTRERLHDGSDIDMYDLLRSALRHRPEYIVVGEVRGEEAVTLFQAMNTGHTTFSTMHADSVETVVNRLENEPIDVPRAMVQSLDLLSVQTLTRHDGERVRRTQVVGEIGGIDGRTGELDYASSYRWEADGDAFARSDSGLLEEIRRDRGWSRSELLRERRRRERFLAALREAGIDDYRRFTALVNEYYADPERVMDRIDDGRLVDRGAAGGDRS